MGSTFEYKTIYCSKEVTIDYEATPGEDNFFSAGHICDGGGSGPEVTIISVQSDVGIMLHTDRKREEWELQIADKIAENIDYYFPTGDHDDYGDNYM